MFCLHDQGIQIDLEPDLITCIYPAKHGQGIMLLVSTGNALFA